MKKIYCIIFTILLLLICCAFTMPINNSSTFAIKQEDNLCGEPNSFTLIEQSIDSQNEKSEKIELFLELNYDLSDYDLDLPNVNPNISLDDAQNVLKKHRQSVREYFDRKNNEYLSYINPSSSSRSYIIEISLLGNKSGTYTEKGSVVYSLTQQTHAHDYSYNITYYSPAKHKSECGCLDYKLRTHVVRGSDPGRFKQCVDCGGLVDTQNYDVIILNTQYVLTQNGSYSLPNGVIVLVDEDLQSYLNGTLIFDYGTI